jgi:hypothetical protein
MKERVYSESPEGNGRIILKLMLENPDDRFWNRLVWFTIRCEEERL